MAIASINPATGETIRTFAALDDREIEQKLRCAVDAFDVNRRRSFADRAKRLARAADILERDARKYGTTITMEMGKPIKSAIAEVQKCALACRYYVENGERQLSDIHIKTDADESYVHFQPIGPVLAVMPWNFPFWQVFRFAAPALMAGNVGLLKHSSNVPQSAMAIETILREAGFDHDEFQTLLIASDQVARIIEDERVKAATLTGSEPAGASVASNCGKHIKKTVLELGGSDPFIVMPSADLDQAVDVAVKARIVNNGQSCIAAKRFIVHEKIAREFDNKFAAKMKALKVGDPMDESVDVGPLAMPQIVEDLDKQVRESVKAGAKLLAGGKRIAGKGNFYEPTVLSDIPENAPASCEETFGPVASLFRIRDFDDAVRVANETPFGLGASVWTRDDGEMKRFIDAIDTGQVFVNAMVASDPRLPFGGVKHSGYGRELSEFGIREFVNIKSVYIKKGGSATSAPGSKRGATE